MRAFSNNSSLWYLDSLGNDMDLMFGLQQGRNMLTRSKSVSAQVVCFQVVTVEGGPSHGRRAWSP